MTQYEQLLIEYYKIFSSLGVDVMVFASSLLGLVRDGGILPHDHEIDLCVLASDFIKEPKLAERIKGLEGHFAKNTVSEQYGEMYFRHPKLLGVVAVSFLYFRENTGYINVINDTCIKWPNNVDHDKSQWGSIEFGGETLKTPHDPEAWLAGWYGDDWRTPKMTDWHSNPNQIVIGDLPKSDIKL